ncbi:type VII secretion-associated protein [Actinophytocola oryzae]|uniref:Chaperone protein HscA n=1 Tax=Actinophytocola oryzae TaxID=502181 RepID=A0A4R7VDP5_9PSEU|nr:type VII secretion-associated protein [Actinophytocola oryzae]TDV47167.1 chaperone protein HscA [Actinophytocola oryzae]
MTVRVAVDFGTSSTCVAVSVRGREPQVVAVDGTPLMSSAVYAAPDGTLFVGQEADRQAAVDPSRYEPHPKRRIDEPELLLGTSVHKVRDVIRAVLSRAVAEGQRVGGGPVDQLVLTHPAEWGAIRTRVLRQAGNGLGARIVLVPEPVAAAVFYSASFPGQHDGPVAVLDLGGGTVDVSVVRANRPLATRGDPTFGGADIDQMLLEHVGSLVAGTDEQAWRELVEGRELPDRRRRRVIHQDVRGAKETLSRHNYTDVPMPPPFADAHVTRGDLERLIAPRLERAAELTAATIKEAGLRPTDLAGIFLVGGSSRIPLVSQLVHKHCGIVPTSLDQPETVVARGALRAVAGSGDGTGDLAAPAANRRPRQAQPRPPQPVQPLPVQPLPVQPQPVQSQPVQPQSRAAVEPPPRPRPALPPTPPVSTSRRRSALLLVGASALAAALAIVLVVVLNGGNEPRSRATPQTTTTTPAPGRLIAQYEYQFTLPTDWLQTGGDATQLRTEVKPSDAQTGDDLVLVQQIRLSFDSDADRPRAVGKLRDEFNRAGDAFTGFDEKASFAGRQVIHYQQALPNKDATVDWYVVFQHNTQVSVGCQHENTGKRDREVATACEMIVRTLRIITE